MREDLKAALVEAREVAAAQQRRIDALRGALQSGDTQRIIRCARAVVGMEELLLPRRRAR